jgi:hypothetical protein
VLRTGFCTTAACIIFLYNHNKYAIYFQSHMQIVESARALDYCQWCGNLDRRASATTDTGENVVNTGKRGGTGAMKEEMGTNGP